MTSPLKNIDALDQLIKARTHGAVNIAGIRFQLLYSLDRTGLCAAAGAVVDAEHNKP